MSKAKDDPRDDRGRFQEKPGSLDRKPVSFKVSKEVRQWLDDNPEIDVKEYLRNCLEEYRRRVIEPQEEVPKATPV
ncbi:hypothetical protein [Tolypothrix sp. VBCCA 56010]|uniref:hypothetical protein n=1 Tax=Tolypothrix sp. VBCCA 56010 TaxID=3137731 RepID=UPI003D7EAD54